ncbi:hypothetical protein Tco_0561490 [Tanacetum coccineum]
MHRTSVSMIKRRRSESQQQRRTRCAVARRSAGHGMPAGNLESDIAISQGVYVIRIFSLCDILEVQLVLLYWLLGTFRGSKLLLIDPVLSEIGNLELPLHRSFLPDFRCRNEQKKELEKLQQEECKTVHAVADVPQRNEKAEKDGKSQTEEMK